MAHLFIFFFLQPNISQERPWIQDGLAWLLNCDPEGGLASLAESLNDATGNDV